MQPFFHTLRSGGILRRFLPSVNRRCWLSVAASKHMVGRNCSNPHGPLVRRSAAGYSSTSTLGSNERPDPFARRPTKKCDPYGQGGKPLTSGEAFALLRTVEPEWQLLQSDDDDDGDNEDEPATIPFAISKVYWHDEYMDGAKFTQHVAAVAQMNAQHFPHRVVLERKLDSRTKSWKICTTIVCRTHVLQGLSHHDFYLATLIDIEAQRPEVRGLLAEN